MNRQQASERYFYIGTYTEPAVSDGKVIRQGRGEGIYLCKLDLSNGSLSARDVFRGIRNPSYLAIAPSGRFLFGVNEVDDYRGASENSPVGETAFQNAISGSVSSFVIEKESGKPVFINSAATLGGAPCYVSINVEETHVFVCNYISGNLSVFPLDDKGRLREASCVVQHRGRGTHPVRQESAHAHSVFFGRDSRLLFASDLGVDKIFAYKVDYAGPDLLVSEDSLTVSTSPGAGPRHCVFSREGNVLYVMNELNLELSAYAFNWEQKTVSPLQSLWTVKKEKEEYSGADIGLHPNGKWLYASIRGADLIVHCEIDPVTQKLARVSTCSSGGKTPRNFSIDPDGRYLLAANQDSDTIAVFSINQENGSLSRASSLQIPNPVCIKPVRL